MSATTTTASRPLTEQSPRVRIGPATAARHGMILAGRNIRYLVRTPSSLIDTVIQPILFLLVFVFLFGGAIAGSWQAYLQTLVPGLLVQITMYASIGTGMALNTDISKGVFDRFRSLPIARSAPLVGAVFGDVLRYAVALVVLLLLAFALGFRIQTDPLSALVACALVVLFGLTLCWMSVIIGMVAPAPQAVPGIAMAVILPLTFGSNIFAAPETMPGWLEFWVGINPVSSFVAAVRGLMLGGPTLQPILVSLVAVVCMQLVLMPLALWTYLRRMR